MPNTVHFTPKNPANHRSPGHDAAGAALLAGATPALYLDNPFRRLGLPVMSPAREIFRRIDELKVSVELGTTVTPWAFAPETALTVNEIREAAQKLKTPRDRLIHEFFWFWPESYPLEAPDEALAFLARGETAPALASWLRTAEKGSRAARHNLAVYHHMLVLDWERLPAEEESRLDEVWPQTLEYWQAIFDDEPLWALLRVRVEKIADPQLPVDFVAEIRTSLPAALAKINAALLLGAAERGRTERVALHASLIALVHRDAVGVRRTLEASAAPVARRIDSCVVAAQRHANDESVPALRAAVTLVRNSDADLRLVETLCGHEEAYTELSSSVADAALACLVAHQRSTKDDQGCLPLLVYLLHMAVTPELRRRLEETYQVIRDNLVSAYDPGAVAEKVGQELEHRLIKETILPQLDTLQLTPPGRLQFTSRIAEWLADLANTAWREHEQFELAGAVLTTALELPCEPEVRARLEEQRSQLDLEAQQRREKPLRLKRAGHVVAIDASEIAFDEERIELPEITGLRHGITSEGGWVVAWRSAERDVVLDATNVLAGESADADYEALLEALYRLVVPGLTERLAKAIRGKGPVFVGETFMSRTGAALATSSHASEEVVVPYARLQHRSNEGGLIVSDLENPALNQSFSLSEVWNAVILGSVIDVLARDANPVLT